jgi:glycosyltransferase involved in cell wall biosynthesis
VNQLKEVEGKKVIVISAINFFEGGPLSLLKDCLAYINNSAFISKYKFLILVHRKELFDKTEFSNVDFHEFPKSRSSYFYRLYYEFVYFKEVAKKNNVIFWLSLHDITPNVGKIRQAVYCHNPSPFDTVNLTTLYHQPTQFSFRLFYRFLYSINIKKNIFVIVQQKWIKDRFEKMFPLDPQKIIVATPTISKFPERILNRSSKASEANKLFFFPTFPRPFKNIEIICKAAQILVNNGVKDFRVLITISGTENKYAERIVKEYGKITQIGFVGLLSREKVYEYYSLADCLIFPSRLETWGLPISEFKQFNKPIFVSDLPYARETVNNYEKANFFDPNDAAQLAKLMSMLINDQSFGYDDNAAIVYSQPYARNWEELFALLITSE